MKLQDIKSGDLVVDLTIDEEGNPEALFLEVLSTEVKSGNYVIDFDDDSHYVVEAGSPDAEVEFSVFRNGEWL